MAASPVEISQPRPESRSAAIDCLFQHLDPADRSHFVESLLAGADDDGVSFEGLFEARQAGQLVGAVWAQTMPGDIAAIWPPGVALDKAGSIRDDLIAAAIDYLNPQRLSMAQVLVDMDDEVQSKALQRAGFTHLADLLYLMSLEQEFPASAPTTSLALDPISDISDARLQDVVERTYAETKDCPQLAGTRRLEDVLAGYRATGDADAARWWIVRQDHQEEQHDVGCLLMADHPGTEHWELVYMGLVPSARGEGRGLQLVRQAQWETRQAGRLRLVLAVDAANSPAINMYDQAGFFCWDRKRVYWRRFSNG